MRWTLTAIYTILIFSTLGIVRSFADSIRSTGNLTSLTFLLVTLFLLFLFSFNILGTSKKQFILRLILILCFISLTMFFTRLPEEKIHVVEYGLLGWLIGWSLFEPAFSINRIGFAILLGWTIGLCDEIIQYFLPNRVYDIRDVTLNGLSTTLGLFFIGLSRLGQNSLNKVKSYESDE